MLESAEDQCRIPVTCGILETSCGVALPLPGAAGIVTSIDVPESADEFGLESAPAFDGLTEGEPAEELFGAVGCFATDAGPVVRCSG